MNKPRLFRETLILYDGFAVSSMKVVQYLELRISSRIFFEQIISTVCSVHLEYVKKGKVLEDFLILVNDQLNAQILVL